MTRSWPRFPTHRVYVAVAVVPGHINFIVEGARLLLLIDLVLALTICMPRGVVLEHSLRFVGARARSRGRELFPKVVGIIPATPGG